MTASGNIGSESISTQLTMLLEHSSNVAERLAQAAAACAYSSQVPSFALLHLASLVRLKKCSEAAKEAMEQKIDLVDILASPRFAEKVPISAAAAAAGSLPVVQVVDSHGATIVANTTTTLVASPPKSHHAKRYVSQALRDMCDCHVEAKRKKINDARKLEGKSKTKVRIGHDRSCPCWVGSENKQISDSSKKRKQD